MTNGADFLSILSSLGIALLGGILRTSTPFLFVSLGETITEKSGRINLGLEGTLMLGAVSAFGVSLATGNPFLGVLAAGITGLASGLLHGFFCGFKRVSSIAIGIAFMIFGTSLAFYLGKPLIQPQAPHLPGIDFGFWSENSALREALKVNFLFIIGILLAPFLSWFFRSTRYGLLIRMAGENAEASRSRGFSPETIRMLASGAGGFLAGIGGSFLSLYYPGTWTEGLSSGQGLLAVALVIFSRWNPIGCMWSSLLFGALGSLGSALQSLGFSQGFHLFNAAPAACALLLMLIRFGSGKGMRGRPSELSVNS